MKIVMIINWNFVSIAIGLFILSSWLTMTGSNQWMSNFQNKTRRLQIICSRTLFMRKMVKGLGVPDLVAIALGLSLFAFKASGDSMFREAFLAGILSSVVLLQVVQKKNTAAPGKPIRLTLKNQIKMLEGELFSAKISLSNITKSLKSVQEKLRYEKRKRKEAEDRLAKYEVDISSSEQTSVEINQLYASTQKLVNHGSWKWVPSTDKLFWTPGVYKVHDLPLHQPPSLTKSLKYIHPDYRATMENALKLAVSKCQSFDIEVKLTTESKNCKWVRLIGTPVSSASEQPTICGLYMDIDHEKRSAQHLTTTAEEYRQKIRSLQQELEKQRLEMDDFSYSVSHDLRAPMRIIDGFSEVLFEDYKNQMSPEDLEILKTIRYSAQKMNLMMNKIMAVSTIGRTSVVGKEIDTKRLIHRVTKKLKKRFKNHAPKLLAPDSFPQIVGDEPLIEEAIMHILDNAFKFTMEHTKPIIKISYLISSPKNIARFQIEDNGVGFKPKFQDRIFKAFKKLTSKSHSENCGMGLTIAKKIIEQHHGSIGAEGQENQGAIVWFELPIKPPKSELQETSFLSCQNA